MTFSRIAYSLVAAALVLLSGASTSFAQTASDPAEAPGLGFASQFPGLGGLGGPGGGGGEVSLSGKFEIEKGSRRGRLAVIAMMQPSWHVYSITQLPGATQASSLDVEKSDQFKVTGEFKSDVDPEVKNYEYFSVPVEEHSGAVTWTAPIELAADADPAKLTIKIMYNGQVCQTDGVCIPIQNKEVLAKFAGEYAVGDAAGEFRGEGARAAVSGYFAPKIAAPGDTVKFVLTLTSDEGWHVYPFAEKDPETIGAGKPTMIALTRTSGWPASRPKTSSIPQSKSLFPGEPPQQFHEGAVSWTIDLHVPKDAEPGKYAIGGLIGFSTCDENSCLPPEGAAFDTELEVASEATAGQVALEFRESKFGKVAEAAARQKWLGKPEQKPLDASTLAVIIGSALLGGLILNLMPCVLPVIGLKILSFAEQGGQSRAQILSLNLWFSFGLLLVFLILGTLAAFLNLGWGEQFTHTWFKVAMTVLVFAMALSFLGVWEIPIPGFVGVGKSNELQAKEGISGAFFKGVFTTILATPCSGPFLGPVFGYTLSQPPIFTYLIFGSVGVGMASPYLLIGAFPSLVRFLPKPGAWMDTFKQLMGFILLGTVVYLFTTIKSDYFIATLTLVFGIWFACWWIGRTPVYAAGQQKLRSWLVGTASAALIGYFAFTVLGPHEDLLDWKPYNAQTLAQAQSEGKTVMIDFTAEWCPTCKWNLANAINTRKVQKVVEGNGVVPLLADWTDRSDEIKNKLAELDSRSIPVLAIYPAGKPGEVIVLRDLLSESTVIEALEQAGPSQPEEPTTSTAMN